MLWTDTRHGHSIIFSYSDSPGEGETYWSSADFHKYVVALLALDDFCLLVLSVNDAPSHRDMDTLCRRIPCHHDSSRIGTCIGHGEIYVAILAGYVLLACHAFSLGLDW